MRKFALMAGGALALAFSTNANAALVVITSGDSAGTFRNFDVTCTPDSGPCAFSDTATFVTPHDFTSLSATISSILNSGNLATNIDFTSVMINGVEFAVGSTGSTEFRFLSDLLLGPGKQNTLTVSGTTGGDASYSGTLSFAGVAGAIPEPSTWLMMIMGIGFAGMALRRRSQTVRLTYS
jgi:hypothetical protein